MRHFLKDHLSLVASLSLSVLLLVMRILFLHEITFIFLAWNLFLAVIPYALTFLLDRKSKIHRLALLMLCILFLPNSPYMITDLFHLRLYPGFIWYDTLLIVSFAWSGMLLYSHTLQRLDFLFTFGWRVYHKWLAVLIVSVLCAFGIYLGRYVRFNSWDIFSQPAVVSKEISKHLFYPLEHPRTWGMTLIYTLFLMVGYFNFVSFGKVSVNSRLKPVPANIQ